MVKASDLWLCSQLSTQQLPDSNCMSTLLETRQRECLPSLTNHCTCKFSVPVALPGSTGPRLRNAKAAQINEAYGPLYCSPSDLHTLLPTPNPYISRKQSASPYGLSGMVVPNAKFSESCQKGFLIFDQTENQTRLIYNYVCPPTQNPSIANAGLNSGYDAWQMAGYSAKMDQIDSAKSVSCEASDGNKSEMHEDTEEINALLCSDDDANDSSNEYGEDDEVTSTGHFPSKQMKEDYERQEHVGELTEEVASSDGPNKRQKMFDGGYNKSSPLSTASLVNLDVSHEYENNVKSGYADGQTGVEGSGCTLGNMGWSKKDEILQILRVLESIIPGVKGKDPLLVIDGAIDYLTITKLKAESLGVSFI